MSLIVQKYGGSSVATEDRIRLVAKRISEARNRGDRVVAVVSAMGKTTHELLERAKRLAPDPSRRELDVLLSSGERISMSLLAMTLNQMGVPAVSLSGPQAGIETTDDHFDARIIRVRPDRIRAELDAGKVVVVAGFQGSDSRGEITTIGRGGSDTTAVALAAALRAKRAEIYSDVDGVFSADPRKVDGASRIDRLLHPEMLALARFGAKVLNAQAVDYAMRHGVEIRARCTFDHRQGTAVCEGRAGEARDVVGVAGHGEVLWVRVADGARAESTKDALEGIFLEQPGPDGAVDLLVATSELADPEGRIRNLKARFGEGIRVTEGLGSASAVGLGLGESAAPLEIARKALREADVPVRASFRSPHALTCLVDAAQATRSLQALHATFLEDQGAAEGAA